MEFIRDEQDEATFTDTLNRKRNNTLRNSAGEHVRPLVALSFYLDELKTEVAQAKEMLPAGTASSDDLAILEAEAQRLLERAEALLERTTLTEEMNNLSETLRFTYEHYKSGTPQEAYLTALKADRGVTFTGKQPNTTEATEHFMQKLKRKIQEAELRHIDTTEARELINQIQREADASMGEVD